MDTIKSPAASWLEILAAKRRMTYLAVCLFQATDERVTDPVMKSLVGKQAIEFNLMDTNDQQHQLADSAGHWLLLVFHRHLG